MLSRTAANLFWLARYVERADNVARILMAGHRMDSLATSLGSRGTEWQSTLVATGCGMGFQQKHGAASAEAVIAYLVTDTDNPSSIFSCIETARRNARAVRPALTNDMWNALNETWHHMRSFPDSTFEPDRVTGFLEWVKERSLMFAGAYAHTMLRNDAYFFTCLGTDLERADNTARILDVKYHILLPTHAEVGGTLDYHQWQSILSSVSALRSYQWIYHERLKPWLIAELLILRPEMPRSLRASFDRVTRTLGRLEDAYGGRRGECHRLAGEIDARLRFGRIEDIFQRGLHEFLAEFVRDVHVLGQEIGSLYLH